MFSKLKHTVASFATIVMFSIPLAAQTMDSLLAEDDLLTRLKTAASPEEAKKIEREIRLEWSKTGSPAMDLLLRRGRDALEVGDPTKAIDHLTALTDHAPDFAEGFHMRGMAYYQTNLYGPAIADLGRALTLNPDHFAAIRGLGAVLEQVGEPEKAYHVYEKVLAIHPNDTEVQDALKRLEVVAKGQTL